MNTPHQQAADALWNARLNHAPIAPLRQWLAPDDVAGAYAVQRLNGARRLAAGARLIGRKIGLTSAAVQKQLGVNQPDFGVLFDDMLLVDPGSVDCSALLQPKIEGEIAFIVAHDILEPHLPRAALARHAGDATPAFEIVDSAVADWKISLADTIADNASCGAIVTGTQRTPLASFDARLAGMVLTQDEQIVSLGVGAASLGDPLNAFAWLADLAIQQGEPLRRGEIILTGALGPMVPFVRGRRYRLEIAGFTALDILAE